MRWLLFTMLVAANAMAQVPDSGRWQELRFTAAAVGEHSEDRYIERTVSLAAAGHLDRDRALLARARRIANGLVASASALKPEAANWQWEVHVTDAPDVEAECLAGGKLLLGSRFIRNLRLNDGELAILLAHEIAHAVAEHQRETLSEALLASHRFDLPVEVVEERLATDLRLQVRLARLSAIQEREADQLGMVIAHQAGWPAAAMLSFYRKLAKASGPSLVASHPDAASRISMAQGMNRLLGN